MDKESRSQQINSQQQMSPMQILQMGFNPQQLQVLMHQYQQQQQQQQQQLAFQSVCTKYFFSYQKRILHKHGSILVN